MEGVVSPDDAFWKGRNVLITGHTGFQGTWLALWLARLGARVTGFALSPTHRPNLFSLALKPHHAYSVVGDIRIQSTILDCMRETRPEIVFHLAAQPLVSLSYSDPVTTYATNVMGTVHLLEAIRKINSVQATVIGTSDKCYENDERNEPYSEQATLGGRDPYSSSKACAEFVVRAYRDSFFNTMRDRCCRVASARAGNVIGGGDWAENRLIPDLVRAAMNRRSAPVRNCDSVRPWQHVLEPLSGYIRLAESLASASGPEYAGAWNFGPSEGDCRPVSHLVGSFMSAWGEGARWHRAVAEIGGEANVLKIDSSKALAALGWRRRLDLDTGLYWTVDWYRRQRDGADAEKITLDQIERYQSLNAYSHG